MQQLENSNITQKKRMRFYIYSFTYHLEVPFRSPLVEESLEWLSFCLITTLNFIESDQIIDNTVLTLSCFNSFASWNILLASL